MAINKGSGSHNPRNNGDLLYNITMFTISTSESWGPILQVTDPSNHHDPLMKSRKMRPYLGVSKNRGIPKWMVKTMVPNPMNKCMIWGEKKPIFGNIHFFGGFTWARGGGPSGKFKPCLNGWRGLRWMQRKEEAAALPHGGHRVACFEVRKQQRGNNGNKVGPRKKQV